MNAHGIKRKQQLFSCVAVYEPVYNEYEKIKNKFEIEMECRHHAEEFASKVRVVV